MEQKNAQILQVMRFENNADKTVYLAHILKKNVLKYYTNEIRSFFLYVLLIRCNYLWKKSHTERNYIYVSIHCINYS